jgi:hypothetical protein
MINTSICLGIVGNLLDHDSAEPNPLLHKDSLSPLPLPFDAWLNSFETYDQTERHLRYKPKLLVQQLRIIPSIHPARHTTRLQSQPQPHNNHNARQRSAPFAASSLPRPTTKPASSSRPQERLKRPHVGIRLEQQLQLASNGNINACSWSSVSYDAGTTAHHAPHTFMAWPRSTRLHTPAACLDLHFEGIWLEPMGEPSISTPWGGSAIDRIYQEAGQLSSNIQQQSEGYADSILHLSQTGV